MKKPHEIRHNENRLFTLDIETATTADPAKIAEIADGVRDEHIAKRTEVEAKIWRDFKKEETVVRKLEELADIDKAISDATAAALAKTALCAGVGEVFCVGYAIGDAPAVALYRKDRGGIALHPPGPGMIGFEGEKTLLEAFMAVMEDPENYPATYTGHNLKDFDLRFLWQRAIVLGVKPSHHLTFALQSRYPKNVFDTMEVWAGWKQHISLNRLAGFLGLGGKGEIHGGMVPGMIDAGRGAEVVKYCQEDVELTPAVALRMGAY